MQHQDVTEALQKAVTATETRTFFLLSSEYEPDSLLPPLPPSSNQPPQTSAPGGLLAPPGEGAGPSMNSLLGGGGRGRSGGGTIFLALGDDASGRLWGRGRGGRKLTKGPRAARIDTTQPGAGGAAGKRGRGRREGGRGREWHRGDWAPGAAPVGGGGRWERRGGVCAHAEKNSGGAGRAFS